MKKHLVTILQYLFFLGLGIGLIWYSSKDLSSQQVAQMKNSFAQTRFLYILPVIFTLLLSHFSRTLRWRLLMKPLGYNPGIINTYLTVLIGYFFNLLMPRLGEVMKCTLLGKYEKIPADKLIGTIVAERAVDLVCLMLVVLIMIITQFSLLGETTIIAIKNMVAGASWIKLAIYSSIFVLALLGIRWYFAKNKRNKIVLVIRKFNRGIGQGLTSIRRINKLGPFIFHTIAIWGLYLLSIWLGFKAFPEVAHLDFNPSISVLVFGSIGMMATQGGIGAYQFAVQKTLLLYGISAVAGLAFGWVIWGAQTAIVLLAGIASLLILPFLNRNKNA
jgi:hypothetical protein